jgi:hypothetical protein
LEDVRVILPIDSSKRAVILAQQLRAASSTADGLSIARFTDSKDTRGSETSHKGARGSATSNHSSQHSPLPFDEKKMDGERKRRTDNYVLTVGKGYRCLIQRFLDNYRDEPNVLDSRNKDYFALMWRTDDWMS